MKVNIIFFLILSFNVNASLNSILKTYLENNFQIKESKLEYESSLLDANKLRAANTFYLSYSGALITDNTESSFTYKPNDNKTTSHTFSLSKAFSTGTSFSFEQNLSSNSGKDVFGQPLAETYGASQKISVSQDLGQNFLGHNFRLNESILNKTASIYKSTYDLKIESGLLSLSTLYFTTAFLKELLDLRAEAVKRSISRLKLVKRRVRDGLAEKADRWQAESALIESSSAREEIRLQLDSSFEQLHELLHQKISNKMVSKLTMKNIKIENKDIKNNKQLLLYAKKLNLSKISLKKYKNAYLPKVSLSFSYFSNDYATTSAGDAFSTSTIGSNQNSKTFGLNVSWPIGNEVEKLEKQKANITKTQAEYSLKAINKNLTFQKEQIKKSIITYNKKVNFQKLKKVLALKTLREMNRMYSKGRVDFDKVIRAEESLIQTESSYFQSVLDYKKAVLNLYFLYGEVESKLNQGEI